MHCIALYIYYLNYINITGCQVLIYPAAFNLTTGPLHWSLLQRSRANDNQLYVACVSPARGSGSGYIAWGHTQLTDPWATVVRELEEKEDMIVEDIGKIRKA